MDWRYALSDRRHFGSSATHRAAVLLASVLALPFAPVHADNGCDLDCSLAAMLAEERLAGAVYSIVDADTTRIGAVGVANAERGDPLPTQARVHIGSVTKTMVALGTSRLTTQRRIDLDAPVSTLLPQIHFDNPWELRTPVTLRHLLDHTSGLDDAQLWQIFSMRGDPDAACRGFPPRSTRTAHSFGARHAVLVLEHGIHARRHGN